LIIALDQWTKCLVRSNLNLSESWSPWEWLAPYARIVNWKNTGAAFGMFQDFNTVFTVLAVVVSLAILYYFTRVTKEDWPLRIALSMQMGGAIGNLIDRLTQGYVTDFVSIGRFAVFNVADSSISVGVVVLVIGIWWRERQASRSSLAGEGAEDGAEELVEPLSEEEEPPIE
jgi:signal peptidase II